VRLRAFEIFFIDPVVPDLGIGHRDNLAAIARVGEDFLVAGHGGIEANFSIHFAGRAERGAGVNGTIFQSELGNLRHSGIVLV
jgi:hypothetical protein